MAYYKLVFETSLPYQLRKKMPHKIVQILLAWYDEYKRTLPWRKNYPHINPYFTWLSEIMLQQTTVATVIPYFYTFIKKWPTLSELAAAKRDDVLHSWQGLGYYNRAHKLHECSILLSKEYNNIFPKSYDELIKLPGIGPYTAAAISAIAFNKPIPVVDGNVERLISRLYALQIPKKHLKKKASEILKDFPLKHRPGDIAQSMMDFANSICTASKPKCLICPLKRYCKAYQKALVEKIPQKKDKRNTTRYAHFLIIQRKDNNKILLYKRPLRGLLPGLMAFISTEWKKNDWPDPCAFYSPFIKNYRNIVWLDSYVNHTFTHFHLQSRIGIYKTPSSKIEDVPFSETQWIHPNQLDNYALPTLMKKIIIAAKIT
mgnify:CR=1 FL=1